MLLAVLSLALRAASRSSRPPVSLTRHGKRAMIAAHRDMCSTGLRHRIFLPVQSICPWTRRS